MPTMTPLVAAGLLIAAASASASRPMGPGPAPGDPADTLYCLKVEAVTGSRIEMTRCWTRAEWAFQGVDVDKEWTLNGVAIRR